MGVPPVFIHFNGISHEINQPAIGNHRSCLQAHSWLGRNGLTVQAGSSGGVPASHDENVPWRYGPTTNGLSRFIMVHY